MMLMASSSLSSPPWLERLLTATFFRICEEHMNAPRNECNMFCLDCGHHAFCFYCKSSSHKDHQVIQKRRSSYHDVVRVADIQKVLDISGVQTYVINSARVFFLNERPQNNHHNHHRNKTNNNNHNNVTNGKSNSHLCEICRRNLLDPFRFCSLGCKLAGIKRNGNVSFVLSAKKDEEMATRTTRLQSKEEEDDENEIENEELREGIIIHKYAYQSKPCTRSLPFPQACSNNSRRRKGIPQRAPLGT